MDFVFNSDMNKIGLAILPLFVVLLLTASSSNGEREFSFTWDCRKGVCLSTTAKKS
jgi:hypothetical protein